MYSVRVQPYIHFAIVSKKVDRSTILGYFHSMHTKLLPLFFFFLFFFFFFFKKKYVFLLIVLHLFVSFLLERRIFLTSVRVALICDISIRVMVAQVCFW